MKALITTLDFVVNDSSIPKLGEYKFSVETSNTLKFSLEGISMIRSNAGFRIEGEEGVLTSYNVLDSRAIVVYPTILGSKQEFIIYSKYNLININGALTESESSGIKFYTDLNDFVGFSSEFTAIKMFGQGVVGDLSNVTMKKAEKNYTYIYLKNTGVKGDLSDVQPFVKSLELEQCKEITGSIENLNCRDITKINFNSIPGVFGSIEGFAENLIRLGRTTGTVKVYGYDSGITYQGNLLDSSQHTLTFSNGSYSFV